jgi:hypothetical protein
VFPYSIRTLNADKWIFFFGRIKIYIQTLEKINSDRRCKSVQTLLLININMEKHYIKVNEIIMSETQVEEMVEEMDL